MLHYRQVPASLPKRDEGRVRREPRKDFEVWVELCTLKPTDTPMPLCDYSVVGAHYVQPGKPVNTPARVRYTTSTEHIFLRGQRDEHRRVSGQLLELRDEFCGPTYSIGDQQLYESATGQLGKGTAAMWIGYDTNHHIEFVSEQAWKVIEHAGLRNLFSLAEPMPRPWLQPELLPL
jgi:hypothetical protein